MNERSNIGEVCQRDVAIAYQTMSVGDAARLMRERHVGSLVVVAETEDGNLPIGMLTDRDIVISVIARDTDPRTLRVGDVMSREPATVRENDSVLDALDLLRRRGIRRVPVTGARGVLVGIVTLDDLLDVVAQELVSMVSAMQSETRREKIERP